MNLATAFTAIADKHPTKTAIYWGEAEYSFARLSDQARRVAARLQREFGVQPGDRVGVWLKNSPEFVSTLFGIWQAGGVLVMINHFLKPDEVAYLLQDSGASVVISEAGLAEAREKLTAGRSGLRFLLIEDFPTGTSGADFAPVERAEADLAALLYTSGTTGHPKGAMLTHGNFLHNVASCLSMLEVTPADRMVVLLPQFHSFMFTVGTLLPLLAGASIVLLKSLHPLKHVLEEILRREGTILPAVPQFWRTLAQAPVPPKWPVRLCISGGAPLPVEVLREFDAKFPTPLIEGYGPTESSPVASVNPIHGPTKAGSVGVPVPNVQMSIRNDAGGELPAGETGEICIRGGNVMQGYWNQPEETAQVLRGGWLYTGDVGHRDADGYYYITDRKKDMLLVNGINVYPREIEEVIYKFPGIKEVAVIGLPDPRRGESPAAFVSVNEGVALDENALRHFVREKLADYKVPRQIVVLPALPRNPTGKILKNALRQLAQKA